MIDSLIDQSAEITEISDAYQYGILYNRTHVKRTTAVPVLYDDPSIKLPRRMVGAPMLL